MGKALQTAGAIIGGAVLMATGVGALAGLQVTAMGIAGIGTMSVANLQLMSAGLMAAGSMLDKPKSTASGSPSDWTSNPDQGIPFLFGRMGVAGKIVHRDEYGQDNRLQGIVSVYSGAGPVKSFQGFTADELPVSFVSNGGTAIGKYSRQMWRSWRLGEQPDTAPSLPTGLDGGAVMPMWGAAYKLSGKACDLLTLQQDSKFSVYPSGEPKPMQVLEGVYGYDPRYDDTYPGGAGPCRYGVRSTYRYIDNAIIAALNWALGMVENGQVVGGIGASLQGVDLPAFVEAANIADANAWTVAAWPDTSEDASVVLDELLEAGGAKRSRVAGKISCVSRGAPRPSIVTITRRDTAGAIELDTGASRFNRLNTITPVIMSEAHKWKHAPMDPVSFAPLVTEDGGKRSDQIKYRFVSKVKQGAELAAYDILDAREPFSGTIPLLPHLRRLKLGDCFDIDEPGFMLDGVKMLVLGRSYDARVGEVRIAFRSETDSKHPLALGKTTTMPEYPGLTVPDPTEVTGPLPGDWTIVPRPPGESGVQVPIIDIVGEVSNGTATAVHFEWWVVPVGVDPNTPPPVDAAWQSAGIWPPTVTSIPVQADPGAMIWIAASYLRGENFSERRFYGPITVPGLVSDDTTHLNREPVQDVLDRLTNTAELADQNRQAVEALEEVYGDTASAATSAAAAAASEAVATQAKADALIAKAGAENSASAAQTAKTAAETARAGAETAQTSAANSATTATGAASTATTQAGIAATAKNDAQAASNAAVTAKNQASASADAAGVSAAASQASSVTATAARDGAVGAAIAGIPNAISADLWTDLASAGEPASRPSLPAGRVIGGAYVAPTGSASSAGPKQRVRWVHGKVIEIRLRAAVPAGSLAASVRIGVARFDASNVNLNSNSWLALTPVAPGASAEVSARIACGVTVAGATSISSGPEWLSLGCTPNLNAAGTSNEPGAQMRITAFSVHDITESVNAAGSASAAATSASSAAASETAASQSASAATTAKNQAETARGQAQTAATQAASSRDDAAGSAANASSSATNAANSRDAAAGSASAAAGSASTANTKATEADNSASAAQASQVAANAAKDAAQSSASSASTSASNAAASATTAGEKATAAEGAATTAATRAGEALAYRNQAASSASDASGSAATASTASGTAVAARNDAQAAAATAVAQSSSASASAASAQLAANLAAQVGQGVGYHKNPTWLDWATGSLPPGASIFTGGTTARNTASARYGVCLEVNSSDGGDSGVLLGSSRFVAPGPITHVVVEYEVLLHSGSFRTAGLQATVLQGGGDKIARVHLFDEHGVGVVGQTYTGAKLVALPTAADNPSGVRLHLFNNFSSLSGGPGGAKNLRWQRVNVRAPTSAEIEAGRVQQVEAQASLALSASVDALTRLGQAAFELILAFDGNPAYIKALAEPGGTEIAFAATKLFLRNVVGDQIVTALELINGEAYFGAPVSVDIAGRRLTIGPGFGISGSQVILWFGPNTVALASMSRTNGYFSFGTDGEVYRGTAVLGGDSSGRKIINFSGRSTSGASYALLASGSVSNAAAGNIIQANVTPSLFMISPGGATTVGGFLQLWEQNAAGKANIGAAVPFLANSETGTFDAKPMLGSATKSGAVTYGVDWRADAPGTVNVSNAAGQVDVTALRSL
ncbi:hypothetical protein D1604_12830 [Brevundimonas sp. LPMIX5]|uniref:coiled-coil domain-containing protein n=1 Tax=Brevundimonas sp. LPMIX5 TaxID=2305887 RepID=UPI000E6668DD|nr:hypothetical protein [Brevundimonas sp. LPMIX5]RIJ65197.1 hypothetical protein D1604_12830 [Brevundimonas sp. LPMIX5]